MTTAIDILCTATMQAAAVLVRERNIDIPLILIVLALALPCLILAWPRTRKNEHPYHAPTLRRNEPPEEPL